jgi:tetratricopeptide (TPR) repeat protein
MVMGRVQPKRVLEEAKALEAQGKNKEASRRYASLIQNLLQRGKFSEALLLCEKALALSPQSSRLHLTKSVCLWELKRADEALSEIEHFAVLTLRQSSVNEYLAWASDKLRSHLKLHQRLLEKVLAIDRTRPEFFFQLARVLFERGKVNRALETAFNGIQTGPDDGAGVSLLKEFLNHSGRTADLSHLEKMVQKTLSLEQVRKLIIGTSDSSGSLPSKSGLASSGQLTSPPAHEEPSPGTLRSLIQELEEELGGRPKGIEPISDLVAEFTHKALRVLGEDSKSLIDLGIAYKEMGLISESKEILIHIAEEDALYPQAQVLIGEIEFDQESWMGALDVFQKLLRREQLEESIQKESLYYVSRLFFQLGDYAKARLFADHLMQMDSHYRNLSSLRSAISTRLKKTSD